MHARRQQGYTIYGRALEQAGGDEEKAAGLAMAAAGWRLEQIAKLQEERTRVQARLAEAQFWAAAQTDKLNAEILRHTYLLDGFYEDLPPAKGKTIVLPEGKIARREARVRTEKDEEAALEWIQEHPELVEQLLLPQPPKVNWPVLRKGTVYSQGRAVWEQTGEVMEIEVKYESLDAISGEATTETEVKPVLMEIQPARSYTVQVTPAGGEAESPWMPDEEELDWEPEDIEHRGGGDDDFWAEHS